MASSGDSKVAIIAAMVGNGLISVSKFVGSYLSGSSAMFSEGIHSLVDTGNQGLLLFGFSQASKPANEQFPFGRGKEIYFWSFVVAIIIFALGGGFSLYEGIHQLLDPQSSKPHIINYIVLVLSIFFELGACYFAFREFNKMRGDVPFFKAIRDSKDPSLIAIIFEDSAAVLGLFVALLGVGLTHYTGNPIYDGLASVFIGVILITVAIWLAIETKSLLIGESANPKLVSEIKVIVNRFECVDKLNHVLSMHLGPKDILLNLSIDFKDSLTAGEVEKAISEMTKQIKTMDNSFKKIFIEAESLIK